MPEITNREARHNYTILESFETGIVLCGCEVKSLREGRAALKDSFARIEKGELFLYNMYIAPYEAAGRNNPEPKSPRKLLLHKSEIAKLQGAVSQRGYTLVPLKLYFKHGIAKVELALCKGKRQYDKREAIKRREVEREIRRGLREKR